MTGKQEGPYKGEETKAEEDKVWQYKCTFTFSNLVDTFIQSDLQMRTMRYFFNKIKSSQK